MPKPGKVGPNPPDARWASGGQRMGSGFSNELHLWRPTTCPCQAHALAGWHPASLLGSCKGNFKPCDLRQPSVSVRAGGLWPHATPPSPLLSSAPQRHADPESLSHRSFHNKSWPPNRNLLPFWLSKNLCYAFIYPDGALLRVWWTLDGPRNVLPGRLLRKPKVTIVHEVFASNM